MSENALDKVRSAYQGVVAPVATQVVTSQGGSIITPEVRPLDETYQVTTLKRNNSTLPPSGLGMKALIDEMAALIVIAMHKAGVNSVASEHFGIFDALGVVPKGFKVVQDPNLNRKFFVLKDSNRGVEIYKQIINAVSTSIAEVVSFPYIVVKDILLPIKPKGDTGEFEYAGTKIECLFLTKEEIENLNYAFIQEISFCKSASPNGQNLDLLSMHVDREKWKSAPYRIVR